MSPVLAILAPCRHKHWPAGPAPKRGDMVLCDTCGVLREVASVGRTSW